MRFLLFLLIGVLLFGWLFPALLILMVLVAMLVIGTMIWRLLTGGSGFHVYTSRDFGKRSAPGDEEDEDADLDPETGRRKIYIEDAPEVKAPPKPPADGAVNVAAEEEDLEEFSELVVLPATALHEAKPTAEAESTEKDKAKAQ